MKKYILVLALFCNMWAVAGTVKVHVCNPTDNQRQELVNLDIKEVRERLGVSDKEPLVVKNAMRQQVDYQITHDGQLLVDVAVRPKGKTTFTITTGIPEPMRTWVQGKMYPLRKDDVAWENDRGAYRVYGPALQRSGERSYGLDVWTKNAPTIELSERYMKDYEGNVSGWANAENGRKNDYIDLHTSFHLDHGSGLDCYGVGASLGCGTPALMDDKGNLIFPYCYKTYKILDNGPLRFTVELTYNPTDVRGDQVTEHRIISLDKGSNFNKMVVWYDGLSKPIDWASGVVLHKADTEHVVTGPGFVQYADPTESPDKYGFQIYVGCVFPEGAKTCTKMLQKPEGAIAGHALGIIKNITAGQRVTYYFGSAWSSYDVRTQAEWQLRINEQKEAVKTPLLVVME